MLNLEKLNDEQFEQLLNILILYKQLNKNKNVYLNETSIKEAIQFMNSQGKDLASQLGIQK